MDYNQESLLKHAKTRGKIALQSKFGPILTKTDLSIAYTPGIGAVSKAIADDPSKVYDYTIKGNTVAVISDGSAVLGLGDIGPFGALPVMEGKCVLFKELAGIDAFPIVLDVHDVDGIVQAVKAIAPTFAGINLEDIAAPKCFEIETRLQAELTIPVVHDDQHATAIVVLAGVINSIYLTGKVIGDVKVVINGAGAAGLATAKLLADFGIKHITICDSKGIIHKERSDLNSAKIAALDFSNLAHMSGDLKDALVGADIFLGLSAAGALKAECIPTMNTKPIILAMANPVPEILPDEALAAGAWIVGTGRSDFANQINNVLVFPGIFKGLIQKKVTSITTEMKLNAARAIAHAIPRDMLRQDFIIPHPLDMDIASIVASSM